LVMEGTDFGYSGPRNFVAYEIVIGLMVLLPQVHENAVSDRDARSRISGRHGISRE